MSIYSPVSQELTTSLNMDFAPSLYLVPIVLAVGVLWVVELFDVINSRLSWRPMRAQSNDQDGA